MLKDGKYDVITHQTLGCTEEAEITHNNLPLISTELVGFPQLNILLHRHLIRHPLVFTAVEIMFPGPVIFDGHQLINIHGFAVDQAFVIHINALGKIACLRTLVCDVATRHIFPPWLV